MHPAEYGHMHLSIFYRPILVVMPTGIRWKDQLLTGKDIATIKLWQEDWPGIGHQPQIKLLPRARITWLDGRSVLLRGDALVKRGPPLSPGFSSAFDELINHLQTIHHASRHNKQPDTMA